MDDATLRTRDAHQPADLASIVLGLDEPARRLDAPERVPLDDGWHGHQPGFDARSAAVLALVVAVLAALIGWATTVGDQPAATSQDVEAAATSVPEAESGSATVADAVGPSSDAPVAVEAIDLAIGRIVPAVAAGGGAIVAVGIGNAGELAYPARAGATVLLVVDGEVAASEAIPAIEPGESTRVTIALESCPTGTVPVTAVLDPSAGVREADERNNATSRAATFGC